MPRSGKRRGKQVERYLLGADPKGLGVDPEQLPREFLGSPGVQPLVGAVTGPLLGGSLRRFAVSGQVQSPGQQRSQPVE